MENENVNENVNEIEIKKDKYGELKNVLLTEGEYESIKARFPKNYKRYIDDLSYYIAEKNPSYKSHYAVILEWNKDKEEEISTFDTEDFFEAALLRSSQRIKERANKKAEISK